LAVGCQDCHAHHLFWVQLQVEVGYHLHLALGTLKQGSVGKAFLGVIWSVSIGGVVVVVVEGEKVLILLLVLVLVVVVVVVVC